MNEQVAVRNECWVVTEGHAGMESQALGLAERLPLPVNIFRVALRRPWTWLAPRSLGSPFRQATAGSDALGPPWPRLLIGCGRQSVPFSRAVKRASAGSTITVQCQDPRVSPRHFDLVIPPEHDDLAGPNVFPILGSPNRISAARLADARRDFASMFEPLSQPRVAVLVGGTSRNNGTLDLKAATQLASALRGLAQEHGLMISTSRRTPTDAAAMLQSALAEMDVVFWSGSGPNPYLGMLAWADAFIVTSDSVNMVCEAAATGKPVHIVPLEGGRGKSKRFHQLLAERGISRVFSGSIGQWDYAPLAETERAAERIKALLDASAGGHDITG